jgi:aryl-alcohol dehydrogenase-like predicted oxidoreductase
VRRAIEGEINFFDTADSYNHGQSELVTGRLLKAYTRRDETVIATKVFVASTPCADPFEMNPLLTRVPMLQNGARRTA